ncbi:MAG TPA: alpha/beta fold hydrolase [Hyphomicrobiaceae bacterium]|nr:alpha/beta fold hydrolase [Hyphomicrobiaceae bacterium]
MNGKNDDKDEFPDRSQLFEGGRVGVLLIHGLGGTPTELRFIAQGLARAGRTVLCCQLAGHCSTPEELRRSTWQEWYQSVAQAHARLRQQCDIVLAGGLSMGGILALRLAQQHPDDVHGLLLYAPTLKLDGWAMPWHSLLLPLLRPSPLRLEFDLPERDPYGLKDARVRALVVSSMQSGDSGQAGVFSTPSRSFANFNALVTAVRPHLDKVRQPALIVHPRNDDIASLKNAQYLQSNLGGLVDTLVLDNSYHMVTLDQQRHVVAERTDAFVSWVESARAAKSDAERLRKAAKGDQSRMASD